MQWPQRRPGFDAGIGQTRLHQGFITKVKHYGIEAGVVGRHAFRHRCHDRFTGKTLITDTLRYIASAQLPQFVTHDVLLVVRVAFPLVSPPSGPPGR